MLEMLQQSRQILAPHWLIPGPVYPIKKRQSFSCITAIKTTTCVFTYYNNFFAYTSTYINRKQIFSSSPSYDFTIGKWRWTKVLRMLSLLYYPFSSRKLQSIFGQRRLKMLKTSPAKQAKHLLIKKRQFYHINVKNIEKFIL